MPKWQLKLKFANMRSCCCHLLLTTAVAPAAAAAAVLLLCRSCNAADQVLYIKQH